MERSDIKTLRVLFRIFLSRNPLSKKIEKLEEDYKMPYVTSWERIAKKEGVKIGEERGVKIGVKKEKIETARRLLKRGVDIDIIADATGLSKKEIEELAENAH